MSKNYQKCFLNKHKYDFYNIVYASIQFSKRFKRQSIKYKQRIIKIWMSVFQKWEQFTLIILRNNQKLNIYQYKLIFVALLLIISYISKSTTINHCIIYNIQQSKMVSKSPMKIKQFKENIQVERLPLGKLVYSYTDKESNLGLSQNSRLLMMDVISGVIGYYNEDSIPNIPILKYQNLKPMKKKAPIATMVCMKIRNKPAIELKVQEVDFKGKKTSEKWTFSFKNPKMAEDWIREVEEAKKFLEEKPPISQTVGPGGFNNPNNDPMSMTVVKQPPIYPNEFLTNSVQSPKRSVLPIDQPDALGSHLMVTAFDMPTTSVYQQPSSIVNESRISGTGPNIGSSNLRMTGSVVQPENLNKSAISYNNNYTVPLPQTLRKTEILDPSIKDSFTKKPSIIQPSSLVEPPPGSSSIANSNIKNNPHPTSMFLPNSSDSYTPQQPVYISQYDKPNQSSLHLSDTKPDPKKNISDSHSNRPPVYESGNDREWNLQFLNSSSPLQVLMGFRARAEAAAKNIIDELGSVSSRRKYTPFKKQPFECYYIGNLVINIAFLTQEQIQYKWLKNEFRNYNYILNTTENKQSIKVPLAAIVDYKGITALVKARIPKSQQISFNSIYHELDQLQKTTKIDKEILKSNALFYKLNTSKGTYIFVDNLIEFMPFDIQAAEKSCQLRGEFLLSSQEVLPGGEFTGRKSDKNNRGFAQLDEASRKMREYGSEVTRLMENMDLVILNSSEMTKQFHLNGVSMRCLGLFVGQCENPLLKKYFVSQAASRVCKKIIKSELQQEIKKMETSLSQMSSNETNNMVLSDIAFSVLNDIVSQNDRTDRIWRVIIQEVKRKFNITFSKQDLAVGYFLSSLFQKSGLSFNFQYLSKDKNYFRAPNTLRREFVSGFKIDTDVFDITFTYEYQKLNEILNSDPTEEGFHQMVEILGIRTAPLPDYCQVYDFDSRIKWYMGNFIAYGSQEYKQVGVFSNIGQQPPSTSSVNQSLLAMRWLRKTPNDQNGNAIFQVTSDLVTFWGGEYHPLHSKLCDYVASAHVNDGNYESAVTLAKNSLINCIKVSGSNSLASCEKYYQLGDIYFKMGKKEDALSNYQITRQILQANKKTNIDEYGLISLKLALLHLNFSKNSEAASKALEALRIFESPPLKQQHMLEAYEVLARTYQISNQKAELLNLSSLCSKRLPSIINPKVYERMLKIALYPHLIGLPAATAKDLLSIYQQIPKGATQAQATQFLKSQTSEHSGLQFQNRLQKIDRILGQVHNKNLASRYKGLFSSSEGEAQQFLAHLEAIGTILGDNFVMGVLLQASQ